VLPRLAAAGADVKQVREFVDPDGKAVRFPRHLQALEREVQTAGVALVVIDPVITFLSPGVWTASDQLLRGVLGRLARLADRTGAAVVMVRRAGAAIDSGATNSRMHTGADEIVR
jgi:hypothetical protein